MIGTAPAVSTGDLLAKLRSRFAWPEYVLLEEVGFGGDGSFGQRFGRADAIAIGQWNSTGYGLQGFEVKSSRTDWLREVRTVGKADAAFRYCNRFWLVAPVGVASIDELPGTWGWLVPRGETLRIKRQASMLTPEPLRPGQIAHMLGVAIRRGSRDGEAATRENEAYQRGLEEGRTAEQRKYHPDELSRIRRTVDRLEETAGLKLEDWTPTEEMGRAIRFVMNGGLEKKRRRLEGEAAALLQALRALALVVPEIPESPYSTRRVSLPAMLEAIGLAPEDRDHW